MLLEVRNISKTYYIGKVAFPALHNINMHVDRGELLAICGPSGSGKTTLLNIIGCIDKADAGEVVLDNIDITKKNDTELAYLRREYFGFVFQTFNLIPVLTVYENVELPLRLLKKHDHTKMREMVLQAIDEVGLSGLENRKPMELSGGQRQRVAIARALVKRPKVVLADEPTANLDSKTGENIVELMKELNEKEGVTFIFSTHDKLIMKHAKRLINLRDGRIVT